MIIKTVLEKKLKQIKTIDQNAGIMDALERMQKDKIGCLPVLDDKNELTAIISDKDILRVIYKNPNDFKKFSVKDAMSSELIVGVVDDDINYVAGIMMKNKIRHIPIMEKNQLAGLISIGDVVAAQMKHIKIENRYLKLYMEGAYPG